MFESEYHFKFEDLILYQKSISFGEKINLLTETFPKKELYRISSQCSRAADSIAANISEGYASTNANFNRYLKMAWNSGHEFVTWNSKAYLREYINYEIFENNRKDLTELGKMISALRRSLNEQK